MATINPQITHRPPPPSPIPTATGSRSATGDNPILDRYLQNSVPVPDLSPPPPPRNHTIASSPPPPPSPPEVDFESLVSGDRRSVERLFRSAKRYGVVLVTGHGISDRESRALVKQAEQVFGILDGRDGDRRRGLGGGGRSGGRDEIAWVCSDHERMVSAREYIGAERFQEFSHEMDNVSRKLDDIAKELGQIFLENVGKQSCKKIQERESVISLYRYKHENLDEPNQDNIVASHDHALSLHLPFQQCQFRVQLEEGPSVVDAGPNTFIVKEGPSVFEASPDTIIVTVGHQLQEWSKGEFKAAIGELILHPQQEEEASFSIELKCSPTYLNQGLYKKITIFDQFLFGLAIVYLYKVFLYLFSSR